MNKTLEWGLQARFLGQRRSQPVKNPSIQQRRDN